MFLSTEKQVEYCYIQSTQAGDNFSCMNGMVLLRLSTGNTIAIIHGKISQSNISMSELSV